MNFGRAFHEMATVSLRSIDETNWLVAVELSVNDEQNRYVWSNGNSLAQAHYESWWIPLGIYIGDEMVVRHAWSLAVSTGECCA